MHYLEAGLLTLPVVLGLAYFVRDIRRKRQERSPSTFKTDFAEAIGEATVSSIDIGPADPTIEQAAGKAAHTAVAGLGQAIEHVGHWLHHLVS